MLIVGGSLGVRGEEVALVRVGLALREVDLVLNGIDQGIDLGGVDAVLRAVLQRGEEKGGIGGVERQFDHRMMLITGERMIGFSVRSIFI